MKPLDLEPIDLLENFEVYRDSIKIIDVNGDNKLDLVLLGSSDGSDKEAKLADSDKKDKPVDSNRKDTLAVLYNQGNLNFKGEKIKIPMVDKPFRLSILDINSDDIQDMIFSKILGNKLLILISNISSDSGYEYKYSEIIMPTEILDVGITDINDKHKNNEFFVVNAHGISELKFENKKFSLASKLLFKTSPQEKIKQLHIISTPSTKDKVQKTLLAFDSNGDIQSLNIVMPIPDESEIESEIKITSKKFKKTSKTSILSSSDYEAFRGLRFADVNKDGFDDIISILGNKLYVALSGKDKDFELFLNKPIELTMDGLNRNIRIGNFIKKEDNSAKDYLEILTIGELLRPLKAVEKVEDDIKKAFFKESENLKTAAKELMIGEDYFGLVERLGKTLETLIIDLEDVKAKKEIVYKNEEKSDQDIQAAHNIAVYKGITLGSYRFGVLAITVFLVQIIVVSYRYSVKMAAFYNSRADALVAYPHFMYHF